MNNNFDANSNKQIEEMAHILCGWWSGGLCALCDESCSNTCNSFKGAEALYNAGYRKQSEGEWIKPSRYSQHICTICRKNPCQYFGMLPPFCPNCGAKMKGGEE